jgi:putative addiction module component (TIGR02574 family)
MTKAAQAVLADALRLDAAARAELAAELLASLDGPADPDAEAAWTAEIDRRIEAIEAGTIRLEPWEEVKQRIEKDLSLAAQVLGDTGGAGGVRAGAVGRG